MDLGTIRALLFDVDGTLYDQPRLRTLMAVELLTLPLRQPWTARRRLSALRAYRHAQERLRSAGSVDRTAQVIEAARVSGLPAADVQSVVTEWMQERPLKYLRYCRAAGLEALLETARRTGRHAGILSDYPAGGKLAALGVEGRFDPILSATDPEIAALKPSPRGYARACEIWGLEAAEVLYVGDRIDVDAAGAAAAGMPCAIVSRRSAPAHMSGEYLAVDSLGELNRRLVVGR